MSDSVDVAVVGAGLAGLICARDLARTGLDVVVLEAEPTVGGRVRTDQVDGLLLDRGFQLLNPAYPRVPLDMDLAALDLHSFDAGVVISLTDSRSVLADPRRSPRDTWSTVTTRFGTLRQRLRLAAWLAEVGLGPADRIKHHPDESLASRLHQRRLDGDLVDRVLRPFLSGTLADADFATSARFAELIIRSFVRGTPGVPATGMQAIPDQLAGSLQSGTIRCDRPVHLVRPEAARVRIEGPGIDVTARAAVIAAGPVASSRLLATPAPAMRSLSTLYYVADHSPATHTMLHVDGDHRGPVVNTVVMTDAAPSYAPGRTLIAASILGTDGKGETERVVRRQLGNIYGCGTDHWEHVTTYAIADALPDTPPGTALRRPVRRGDRIYTCGDHLDTASIQGALVSGHRAAAAVRSDFNR